MRNLTVLLMLCVLLFPAVLFAYTYTESEYQDVVYLKNGSVIHGVIIEQIPNVSVKIKTETGDIWVFSYDEIEKITKEETGGVVIPEMQTWKYPEIPGKIDRKGFLGFLNMGWFFTLGRKDYQERGGGVITFSTVNGIGLGPVFIGAGIDAGFGDGWWEDVIFIPIYGETKFFFMPKSHFTPTCYVDLGVQKLWVDTTPLDSGFLLGGGVGIEYRGSYPFRSINFNFSYRGFEAAGEWYSHLGFTGGTAF